MASSVKAASNLDADNPTVDDSTYAAGSSRDWDTNISGLAVLDTTREATAADLISTGTSQSHRLDVRNLGFSIPTGATIDGIVARITWRASDTRQVDWLQTRLIKAGTPTGDNKATGGLAVITDTEHSRGGSTDLWGATWSPADINDSGFGVALQFQRNSSTGVRPQINYVEVEVYYTESTGTVVSVPKASLVLTGYAPTVTTTANVAVSVPKGSLVLTGYAPSVTATDHKTISVPKGALTLTGYAPTVTVSSGTTIFVPKASLTLTGYAPTVLTPQVIQVPKGGLVLTGYAPDVLTPVTVLVPKGTLTITGYAPTIVVTSNKLIEVPKGALVLRGYAPTVLGTVVAATNRGSYSEPDRRLRERLRKLAIQQAYIEDDEEALAILLATIMREYR